MHLDGVGNWQIALHVSGCFSFSTYHVRVQSSPEPWGLRNANPPTVSSLSYRGWEGMSWALGKRKQTLVCIPKAELFTSLQWRALQSSGCASASRLAFPVRVTKGSGARLLSWGEIR